MSSQMLHVALFGMLEIQVNGTSQNLSVCGTTRSLLQYLMCNHGRMIRREKLTTMFWPDTRVDKRRSSLNTAIWRIKKALKPVPGINLDATAETIRLIGLQQPSIFVDFLKLESAIHALEASGDIEHALPELLYALDVCKEEPLDGLEDEWATVERERLSTLRLRGLSLAMRTLSENMRYDQALAVGRRILALDPFRECTYQEMLCLHVLSGQRAHALFLFKELENVLNNDLGIEPMAETKALRDYLVNSIEWQQINSHQNSASELADVWPTQVTRLVQSIESSRGCLKTLSPYC